MCAKKYCCNLRVAVTWVRATFYIFWYPVSHPSSALLVKYVGFCPFCVSLMRTAMTASEEIER